MPDYSKGATAPQAAGVTPISNAVLFVPAIAYEDFVACKGEQGAKAAGKLRLEGRDYVVQDGT